MADKKNLVDVIGNYCHIDGPHTQDTARDAAESIAELVRYLNHATIPGRAVWPWANTTHRVLGNLAAAAYGLDQLTDQLARTLAAQAKDPTLYDDRRDRPGADTAVAAAMELRDLRPLVGQLARALDAVRAHTNHLGNDEPSAP